MALERMTGALAGSDGARPIRILFLEDSDLDAELVLATLERVGIPHEVDRVVERDAFRAAATSQCYDLILADYVLPSFDGLSALALAREHCPGIPFIFVSGTLGEEIAIESFKRGATDYILKQRLVRLPAAITRMQDGKARGKLVVSVSPATTKTPDPGSTA